MQEIVIRIPRTVYNYIKQLGSIPTIYTQCVANAIFDGTPLPKGHGDLINRKDLIESGIHKGFCDWYDEIKYADTIIEADKTESEN